MRESAFTHEVAVYRSAFVTVDQEKLATRELVKDAQRCFMQVAANSSVLTLMGSAEDQTWNVWFPSDADIQQGDEIEWAISGETYLVQTVSPVFDREGIPSHKQVTAARRQ